MIDTEEAATRAFLRTAITRRLTTTHKMRHCGTTKNQRIAELFVLLDEPHNTDDTRRETAAVIAKMLFGDPVEVEPLLPLPPPIGPQT